MKMTDPILAELHATREKMLAEAGGTLEGLMAKLREDQAKSGRKIIKSVDELPNSQMEFPQPPELQSVPANEK